VKTSFWSASPTLPDFIGVSHAALVFHAAKNTIRMCALSGKVECAQMPWGLVVKTSDLIERYPLRDGFVRDGFMGTTVLVENKAVAS
jgi:hypothetical protein